ncbi:MAG: hypothetical protein WC144_06055 [Sulfurimonas sp.]|jgi:tRNA A-37 threonylcarbamoyl transferase component Bud32|nr:hypothetical protein [Sulfurimonadaceae bacterium]
MKYEVITKYLEQNIGKRVFSFTHNEKKYWLKHSEVGEANIWHKVLFVLSKLLNNNFLKPTVVVDAKASIQNEAKRLKELDEAGVSVAKLVFSNDDFLVVEDSGEVLSKLIDDENIKDEFKKEPLKKFATTLATMHNLGFYHSRPALRDATYKDDTIYLIDFEENLDGLLSLDEAIVRDGFLLIHTLFRKVLKDELVFEALEHYKKTLKPHLWQNLVDESKRYNISYFILKHTYNMMGKDAKAIFFTLKYLKGE